MLDKLFMYNFQSTHWVDQLWLFAFLQLHGSALHRSLEVRDGDATRRTEQFVVGEKVVGTKSNAILWRERTKIRAVVAEAILGRRVRWGAASASGYLGGCESICDSLICRMNFTSICCALSDFRLCGIRIRIEEHLATHWVGYRSGFHVLRGMVRLDDRSFYRRLVLSIWRRWIVKVVLEMADVFVQSHPIRNRMSISGVGMVATIWHWMKL